MITSAIDSRERPTRDPPFSPRFDVDAHLTDAARVTDGVWSRRREATRPYLLQEALAKADDIVQKAVDKAAAEATKAAEAKAARTTADDPAKT